MNSNVGIIIPFYYLSDDLEEDIKTLQATIDSTKQYAKKIIVVDDGTELSAVSNADLIKHQQNQGKGASIRTGIESLLSDPDIDFIIEIDADNDQDPKEAYKFIQAFEDSRSNPNYLVIGDRYSAPEMQNPSRYRETINDLQKLLFSRFGLNIRDSVSGFRGYSRDFANTILQQSRSQGFGIATEQIILAYLNDTTIEGIPLGYAKPREHFTKSHKIAEVLEGIVIHDTELGKRGFQELVDSMKNTKAQLDNYTNPIRINLNGKEFEFMYDKDSFTTR